MPPATQIKVGQTLIIDGELYKIIRLTHITPGKGNAVVQSDLRNIKTGVKTEKRFRSSENVELAQMLTRTMQFLYESDGVYHFMDTESFEQYELGKDLLGDGTYFLVPETTYTIELHDGTPVGISFPQRLTLKIVQTDPIQKGASGKYKPATTESGLVIQVPLFIGEEEVVINTEDMKYVERAKS